MEIILALTFVTILGIVAFLSLTMLLGVVSVVGADARIAMQVIKVLRDLIKKVF